MKKSRGKRRSGPRDILQDLMEEVNQTKKDFQAILESDPENKDFHKIYGMYVGQILDVYKEILKHRVIDKDRLLIDALRCVVNYLMCIKENQAAELIGRHLEEIGEKIKDQWKDLNAPEHWRMDMKKFAPPLPLRSRHLAKTQPCKRRNAGNKPL